MDESKTRIIVDVVKLLDQWLHVCKQRGGGECSPAEWTDFRCMDRRINQWNRAALLLYRDYLQRLPAGGDIVRDRPQLYNEARIQTAKGAS